MGKTPIDRRAAAPFAIDLGERSYDILIGRGLLDDAASFAGPADGAHAP